MNRLAPIIASLAIVASSCSQAETGSGGLFGGFGDLFGSGNAMRVGTTCSHVFLLQNPPWNDLQRGLSEHLERPVQFASAKPFQIRSQLGTGRLSFALVDVADYGEITSQDVSTLLLAGISAEGESTRVGLMITPANSKVEGTADISGKRFAFGPRLDPVLHVAALELLGSEGIAPDDLAIELTIPFGHYGNSVEIARALLMAKVFPIAAGVVQEADFHSWPEHGGNWLQPSQDQFRVLGQTRPVPQLCWVASNKAEPALVARVKGFLLEQTESNPKRFAPLGLSGFAEPELKLYEPFCEIIAKHKLSKTPLFR